MRRIVSPPFAWGMSLMVLVALAVCGMITRTAQPTSGSHNPWRAICAPQHPICAPVVAGGVSALALLAVRSRADLAPGTATEAADTDATSTTEALDSAPDVTSASATRPLIAGIACLWLALLVTYSAPRRTGSALRRAVLPLPLRQITEHRVAPAP